MKIAIVGPGALGCLLGGLIKSRTKEEIWLFDNDPARAKQISQEGVRVEGLSGSFTAQVSISADSASIGRCDLVIICVKSYSTEEAAKDIKPLLDDKTHVLTLQNGIGNVQVLNDYFGSERVVAGVTSHGATLLGIGHVRHAGKGETIIGKLDGKVLGVIREAAGVMTRAGFETKICRDIDSVIWSKLIISVGINALTAITRLNNGKIIEVDGMREIMRSAVQEAVKVVKRKRIKLIYDDPLQKVESVAKATAGNISSMLQDMLGSKKTEIDFINGAIVRQARSLGIPTPVNEVLTGLVKTIEQNYTKA